MESRGFGPVNSKIARINLSPEWDLKAGNDMILHVNTDDELGLVERLDAGETDVNVRFEDVVDPPQGVDPDQFDQQVLETIDNLPLENLDYGPQPLGPDCNSVLEGALNKAKEEALKKSPTKSQVKEAVSPVGQSTGSAGSGSNGGK